jgi:hypothetical protein
MSDLQAIAAQFAQAVTEGMTVEDAATIISVYTDTIVENFGVESVEAIVAGFVGSVIENLNADDIRTVQTVIEAFLAHAIAMDFAPEVMAYLKVRPDRLDDTQTQLANDHLIGASPRGWEDISNVLRSGLSDAAKRVFVQGRIGAANAAEFFGVLREMQAAVDVVRLLAAKRGDETAALLPRTLDGLYGMIYGLLAASREAPALERALEIVEQLPEVRGTPPLPLREAQTLAMELLMQKALGQGLETTILDSPAYQRYSDARRAAERGA